MFKGGGGGKRKKAKIVKGPFVLSANATEQRVSGGRLYIQNARNLRTKVMSNGVEVIVRGHKTAVVGFEKTPWLPHRVHPTKPVTLPAHTVSRQFHLVENPGKPHNNAIGHLLQSIVRSAILPDLVTKTLITTFTLRSTILNKYSNTIVKSREEVISNVMTQKFRPTMEYIPSLKSEPSTMAPELLASFMSNFHPQGVSSSPWPYITETLTTTYIYKNTFSAGGVPVVLTSRETVSNVLTIPAYLSPSNYLSSSLISSTRVFETETYYSIYSFSKTIVNPSESTKNKVITTVETVTQEVITVALLPVRSHEPSLVVAPTPFPPMTRFTTFTHLFTEIDKKGQLVIRSSTSITSETVTEKLEDNEEIMLRTKEPSSLNPFKTSSWLQSLEGTPTMATTIHQTKTLTPVLLYATKVYFTTFTFYTTVKGSKDATGKIHSRTQVVSRVVTEAISTAFDLSYVNQLKSSYLSKHSILLDITSSVQEIIPTKTIEFTETPGTLVTQQVFLPHWPKDDEQLAFEVFEKTTTPDPVIKIPQAHNNKPANQESQSISSLHTPTISSSEEHFDEVKEGVHKIVSVLTNTKVTPGVNINSYLKPSRTLEYLYSTTTVPLSVTTETLESASHEAFMEEITLKDRPEFLQDITTTTDEEETTEGTEEEVSDDQSEIILTERPVTHIPTPPLTSFTTSKYTTMSRLTPSSNKPTRKPIIEDKTDVDLFPDIGPPPKSIIIDYPSDINDYTDSDDPFQDEDDDVRSSSRLRSEFQASTALFGKRTGTIYFDTPVYSPGIHPTATAEILNLISEITSDGEAYEEIKDDSEEDIPPPKIYNIPSTFDTKVKPVEPHSELERLNQTLQAIRRKQAAKKPPITTTTTTTTPEPELDIDEVTTLDEKQEEEKEHTDDNENEENNSVLPTEQILADEILDEPNVVVEESETPEEEEESEDNNNNNNPESDEPKPTETPTVVVDEVTESHPQTEEKDNNNPPPPPEEEENLKLVIHVDDPETEDDFADIAEKIVFLTSTNKPHRNKNKYTTSKRPHKKTRRPVTLPPLPYSEEDSAESSTHIYSLNKYSSGSGESISDEEDNDNIKRNKYKNKKKVINDDKNNSDQEDDSSESDEKQRPSGTGAYLLHEASGPSKSGISFPVAAVAGGSSAIATAATGINWKPLLNLGAIGLGGLGASTLTKLGPLFNSVAGYMKGALVPISRNDTQHQKMSYKSSKTSQKGQRPYARLPPKEANIHQHTEPIYIPLGNGHQQQDHHHDDIFNVNQNYRFSDEGIPRRPVMTHANEPNFRPIATDRDPSQPDLIAGPLPPPIHHHFPPDSNFPPNHNYNFQPPNDNLPNIYTQINQEMNLHNKNGDPPPPTDVIHNIVPGNPIELGGNNKNSHQQQQNSPSSPGGDEIGPEGKTEFILRPLQNLMNGRPMFDSNKESRPPGQRPGIITPVLKPTNEPQPHRPIFRPRPGPASIEMINEIKDSQRNPFDRPNPTIILPHRKNPNQNNNNNNSKRPLNMGRPLGPLRINIPELNLENENNNNQLPWGPQPPHGHERFNENPFKDGNLNPPKAPELEHAESQESFESHFSHGAQDPFFNQQGFITHDHFNELISTPSPLKFPPKFKPDENNMHNSQRPFPSPFNRPPMFDKPSSSFDLPVRAPRPNPNGGEIQNSEETIYHPHPNKNSDEEDLNFNNNGRPQGPPTNHQNELILHPHNGQNNRPFRPIPGSKESNMFGPPPPPPPVFPRPPGDEFFGQRQRPKQNGQQNSPDFDGPERSPNNRPDFDRPNVGDFDKIGPNRPNFGGPPRQSDFNGPNRPPNFNNGPRPNGPNNFNGPPRPNGPPNFNGPIRPNGPRTNGPPNFNNPRPDGPNGPDFQNPRPNRPDFEDNRPERRPNGPDFPERRPNNGAPNRPDFGDHVLYSPNGQRKPPPQHEGLNSEEFNKHHTSAENLFHNQHKEHSRPPQMPPWPNNSPGPGQLPGQFPSPMNILGNQNKRPQNSDRSSNEQGGNRIRPPQPLPTPPLAKPTQHLPPFKQNPSTVYIVEEDDHDYIDPHKDHHHEDFNNNNNGDEDHPHHHDESDEEHHINNINHESPRTTPNPRDSHEINTQFPKLIIKEVPTRPVAPYGRRPTTTSIPDDTQSTTTVEPFGNNPSTNRALISRLFIRRFSSTTPRTITSSAPKDHGRETTTLSTPSFTRNIPPWANKPRTTSTTTTTTESNINENPTINDLLNFEEKFKQKYGPRKPSSNNPNENHFSGGQFNNSGHHDHAIDKSMENVDTQEYSDEVDELKEGSNVTVSKHSHHPNHHPIHKPPIDVTKYLKDVGEDEFGQLYQGTEDQDTIIDPVNQKIIKSPLDNHRNNNNNNNYQNGLRRNISHFMRRSTTTTEPQPDTDDTTTDTAQTLSSDEEDEFLQRFTVPKDIIFAASSPGSSNLWWPTTFRPKQGMSNEIMDKPTTYRPSSNFNRNDENDVIPPKILRLPGGANSPRPAPQGGMASFYDDEDSIGQIKIKNSEIHKLPPFTRRPGAGIALVRPEDMEEYENSHSSEKKLRDKLNKVKDDKIKEYNNNNNEEGEDSGAYDENEDGSSENSPGVPSRKLTPPSPRPGQAPPLQSNRPSPFETLTNLFRKPQSPVRNDNNNPSGSGPPQPNRKPFIPQRRPEQSTNSNRIQIVRPQQFRPTIRPIIPLNPNIKTPVKNEQEDNEEGGEIKDEKHNNVIPDSKNTATAASSHEVKIKKIDGKPESEDGTGNHGGHRESSYIYDSEYYEDDDEDNVIPPKTQNLNRLPTPINPGNQAPPQQLPGRLPNQQQQQRPQPPQTQNNRPLNLNVGGHVVNNNGGGKPFLQQQRPFNRQPPPSPPKILPPNQRAPGTGFRIFESNGNGGGSRPLPPNAPKTEMEPPPIDSNRLKPPVLELPSSGPIRYKPTGPGNTNSNINRPNLLRPDDDLFKPPDKRPSIHTIASIDEYNKIIGTNTFTAIFPSKSADVEQQEIKPTETMQQAAGNVNPTADVHLEGSEGSVIIPSHSSGANMRLSSVIKYTGGKLETSAITSFEEEDDDEEEEDIEDTENAIQNISISSNIEPTKSSSTRLTIQRTRGPSNNNVTVSSPTTTTTTSSASTTITSNTTGNNNNNRHLILNRRPPGQIIRSTTTSKPISGQEETKSNSTTTTTKPLVRRPFIPTRGPGPNIIPWARRTQSTTVSTTVKSTGSDEENNASSGESSTLRFSPSIIKNISRGISRFDTARRPTTTLISTSVSSSKNNSSKNNDENKSGSSPEHRTDAVLKPTTFRPLFNIGGRRPGFSKESSEEKVTTLVSRFVPSRRPFVPITTKSPSTTTKRPSIFRNVTTTLVTPSSSTDGLDSEYEEYSEEYEDEVTEKPTTNREVTSHSSGNQTVTIVTQVSSEINPTRVTNSNSRGGSRFRNTINVGRPIGSAEYDADVTTRYVTHTESVTVTLTETETTAFTSRGAARTQTILITKTIPPQTLISTIVGTLTLVNTVDVKPTTVRTTIFSEPTKAVYTFVDTSESTDNADESTERVQLSGIVTAGNRPRLGNGKPLGNLPKPEPSPAEPGGNIIQRPFSVDNSGCRANCSLTANQACRSYANGTRTKCECRPGYARMKAKYPCRPTFTYEMKIGIIQMDGMSFDFKDLYNAATEGYLNFITVTKEAIDKAFLATDIKRQFQGSEIIKINPVKDKVPEPQVNVEFLVQLTTNITEDRIKNHLIRTLKASNFSIGRTGISSTRDMKDFGARDFNECANKEYNDCSFNADCINVRGSFSCKCIAGYKDKSSKRKPGRDCQETSGCHECNFHGTCHSDTKGNRTCHCFKWYGGADCQINLKFLLIAITGIGSVLFILVMLCGTLVCKRSKVTRERTGSGRFMRYRSPTSHSQATLERTAIMNDSASSEGRQSPHPITHAHSFTPDSLLIDVDPKGPGYVHGQQGPHSRHNVGMGGHVQLSDVNLMNFSLRNVVNMEQSDRSMAVVIPRAKIRPPSRPSSRHAAIGPDINADLAASERKLISYLDQSPYAQKIKPGSSNQSTILKNEPRQFRKFSLQEQRKISQGALVSSGEAVSAIGGMRRRSTTALEPEPAYTGYEKSVSEVRSFDETIRSPAKQTLYTTDTSRTSCYSCKPPSYCAYSESAGHTMGDKDGASTVYTTQGKLFRMAHDDDTSSTSSSQYNQ